MSQNLRTGEGSLGLRMFYRVMNTILFPQNMIVSKEAKGVEFWSHSQHFKLLRVEKKKIKEESVDEN